MRKFWFSLFASSRTYTTAASVEKKNSTHKGSVPFLGLKVVENEEPPLNNHDFCAHCQGSTLISNTHTHTQIVY